MTLKSFLLLPTTEPDLMVSGCFEVPFSRHFVYIQVPGAPFSALSFSYFDRGYLDIQFSIHHQTVKETNIIRNMVYVSALLQIQIPMSPI